MIVHVKWCCSCGMLRTDIGGKTLIKKPAHGHTCAFHEWALAGIWSTNGDSKRKTPTVEMRNFTADYGPPCVVCGGMTRRAGNCYYCQDCGESTGCS